jgi:plastocyanin
MTSRHRFRVALLLPAAGILVALLAVAVPVLAAQVGVSIVGKSFQPSNITIVQGDTVTWTVTQAIGEPHSVTSGHPGDPNAGSQFDSGIKLQSNGDSYQFTFDTPGTYPYFCRVHPAEMTGVIVVLAPGQTPAGSGAGAASEPGGVTGQTRLIAATILVITLLVLFGFAWLYRRVNRV